MKGIRKGFSSQFTTVIYSLSSWETAYNISWDSIFQTMRSLKKKLFDSFLWILKKKCMHLSEVVLDASKNTHNLWIYETFA